MDFSKLKFSCSSLSKIMSNSRAVLSATGAKDLDKLQAKQLQGIAFTDEDEKKFKRLIKQRENSESGKLVLSKGCEDYLRGIYMKERYGSRYKLLSAETGTGVFQMVRGIKTEKQAFNLLCEIDNANYFVVKKQVENEYLTAKLDVIDAPSVDKATKIFDIKSAPTATDFFNKIEDHFTASNILQMQGYFAITGIYYGEIVHCLVGEPVDVIEEQERLLFEKMCPDGVKTDKFSLAWESAKNSMLYMDIPKLDRLISKKVSRDEETIELIYETIDECRSWLNQYHELHETFTSNRYIE